MSFLKRWQQTQRKSGSPDELGDLGAVGKQVLVIGGGDTGCDCIATALRQVCDRFLHFLSQGFLWCNEWIAVFWW